jgi:hypothetical protein
MPVDTTHPFYEDQTEDWLTARVSVAGEKAIRNDLVRYLPVPPGMPAPQFNPGGSKFKQTDRYGWYASFAEYPEIVAPTVEGFQGLMHEKPPTVKLPAKMEYLIEKATPNGDSLDDLWESVTREMIVAGRQVLVGEVVGDEALSVPYHAESLINWMVSTKREGAVPSLCVIRESSFEPDDKDEFRQRLITRYRELRLVGDRYGVRLWKSVAATPTETLRDTVGNPLQQQTSTIVPMGAPQREAVDGADEEGFVFPERMGAGAFDFIPIDVGNASGLGFVYGHVPVLPMSRRAMSIFRRTADYNRALYVKGDPQAVIISDMAEEDLPTTIGGSGIWLIPTGGDAKYLDIDGTGLPLLREAIVDDYSRFVQEAGRFLESSDSNPNESGRAVEKRLQAQRVTLRSLVIEAGRLMEAHLRTLGRMLDLSESELKEISFVPNMDFTENVMTGQDLLQYVTAKNTGAPWSLKSMHAKMAKGGLTDMTFEDEMSEVRGESALSGVPAPDPMLTTSMADGHAHTYRPGEARTAEANGHSHAIAPDGTIGMADGHMHMPDPRAEDEDPKPDPGSPPEVDPGSEMP